MAHVRNKTLFAKLFICILLSQAFISNWTNSAQQMANAEYVSGMNPGMIMRIEQHSINQVKNAMQEFLPHYLNFDMKLPTEYEYSFSLLFDLLVWNVKWTNISYSEAQLDINDIQIALTRDFEMSMINIKFPALKHWEISATQDVNFWFIPDLSDVQLIFEDFQLDIGTDLVLDEHGFLDLSVYSAEVHFGNSYLYHDNPITAFFMHQVVYLGIVVMENSIYFVGEYIFSNMMGPVMDKFLNHYQLPFNQTTFVRGQDSMDLFTIDMRNTQSPYIGDGWIDFFFSGELLYQEHKCDLDADYLQFIEEGEAFSQIVISESMATCWANNMIKSDIGNIYLTDDTVSALWNDPDLRFNTTSLGEHFPILLEKVGPHKPLYSHIKFKDVNMMFGFDSADLIISYTICFDLRVELSDGSQAAELMYDEIKMVTSANLRMDDDLLFITLLKHKLYIDSQYGQATEPLRNGMDLSVNDYRDFLSSMGFFQNYLKTWFNKVYFKDGLKMPYNPTQLYTSLAFQEKQMHIMIEVEDEFQDFIEDELWDEEAIKERDEERERIRKQLEGDN